jgi:hypothetical protein
VRVERIVRPAPARSITVPRRDRPELASRQALALVVEGPHLACSAACLIWVLDIAERRAPYRPLDPRPHPQAVLGKAKLWHKRR